MPDLVQIYKRLQGQEVHFVGLTTDTIAEVPQVKAIIDSREVPWPIGYGSEPAHQDLGVVILPSYLVVGRDGRIAWQSPDHTSLEEAIVRELAKGP